MDLSRREALAIGALAVSLTDTGRAPAQPLPAISGGTAALGRARSAVGRSTRYMVGGDLPPGAVWRQDRERTDCSGLILWSFGLGRSDRRLGPNKVTTDDIYNDAVGPQQLFRQVARPMVGGIVVYPRYDVGDGIADYGHVGIISKLVPIDPAETGFEGSLREVERFAVVDCSGSASRIFGDAVRESDYLKFLHHDELMAQARRFQPCVDPKKSRPPIFAVSVVDAGSKMEKVQQSAQPACKFNPAPL